MLDEVRNKLACLEAEWEERRVRVQTRRLEGADIESSGRLD
jgi:hypothetical protein